MRELKTFVSNKIAKIKHEDPEMSDEQAAAIAYSYARKGRLLSVSPETPSTKEGFKVPQKLVDREKRSKSHARKSAE